VRIDLHAHQESARVLYAVAGVIWLEAGSESPHRSASSVCFTKQSRKSHPHDPCAAEQRRASSSIF
jgi:hypothetical protein